MMDACPEIIAFSAHLLTATCPFYRPSAAAVDHLTGEILVSISDKRGAVWSKAKPIRGKDPTKYRQDPYGNEMHYNSYGKDSEKGWEIDHIKPKARGGSDATVNLQALNTQTNRLKGDTLKKRSRHSQ